MPLGRHGWAQRHPPGAGQRPPPPRRPQRRTPVHPPHPGNPRPHTPVSLHDPPRDAEATCTGAHS
ncbi:hypothetical protein E6R61_33950 [Streptomyces sp. LRa12]|nr:hypothetical protein E6R61_33950 [Streptomyces sp. LRa12]